MRALALLAVVVLALAAVPSLALDPPVQRFDFDTAESRGCWVRVPGQSFAPLCSVEEAGSIWTSDADCTRDACAVHLETAVEADTLTGYAAIRGSLLAVYDHVWGDAPACYVWVLGTGGHCQGAASLDVPVRAGDCAVPHLKAVGQVDVDPTRQLPIAPEDIYKPWPTPHDVAVEWLLCREPGGSPYLVAWV